MEMSKNEMRFFQDAYFAGLRIKYIDESKHSPYKYCFECHIDGKLDYLLKSDKLKDLLDTARLFIAESESEARHSDSAFFILRLAKIKICFVFD